MSLRDDDWKFSAEELDTLRDALEQRVRQCREDVRELKEVTPETETIRRLVLSFEHTARKASLMLERIEAGS